MFVYRRVVFLFFSLSICFGFDIDMIQVGRTFPKSPLRHPGKGCMRKMLARFLYIMFIIHLKAFWIPCKREFYNSKLSNQTDPPKPFVDIECTSSYFILFFSCWPKIAPCLMSLFLFLKKKWRCEQSWFLCRHLPRKIPILDGLTSQVYMLTWRFCRIWNMVINLEFWTLAWCESWKGGGQWWFP